LLYALPSDAVIDRRIKPLVAEVLVCSTASRLVDARCAPTSIASSTFLHHGRLRTSIPRSATSDPAVTAQTSAVEDPFRGSFFPHRPPKSDPPHSRRTGAPTLLPLAVGTPATARPPSRSAPWRRSPVSLWATSREPTGPTS
jgi:hypothetical protein